MWLFMALPRPGGGAGGGGKAKDGKEAGAEQNAKWKGRTPAAAGGRGWRGGHRGQIRGQGSQGSRFASGLRLVGGQKVGKNEGGVVVRGALRAPLVDFYGKLHQKPWYPHILHFLDPAGKENHGNHDLP